MYRIQFSREAEEHLEELTVRKQRIVVDEIDKQLRFEPAVPTRNRKRMRKNPIAPWELRIDDIRVYYEVKEDPESVVSILAIGIKIRDLVYIGGEIVDL